MRDHSRSPAAPHSKAQACQLATALFEVSQPLLFQPLRHGIQRIIDRRFYRSKYDAAKIVAAYSATLRNEVDLDLLRMQLVTVVQETMQPAHISLWLRPPEQGGTHRAAWRTNPPVSSEDEAGDER